MKNFRDLKVWEKAHRLALQVYRITSTFPKDELYGLTSQMRRASTSIPANVAEGCGRGGDAELSRYLRIAMGSASELEYHILLAKDLGLLKHETYQQTNRDTEEVKKMLAAFVGKIGQGRTTKGPNGKRPAISAVADR